MGKKSIKAHSMTELLERFSNAAFLHNKDFVDKKTISFEQQERIALKFLASLEGYTYSEITQILILIERIVKENSTLTVQLRSKFMERKGSLPREYKRLKKIIRKSLKRRSP